VDSVVRDVEALGERPVEEHVEVFERAHDELRRALDDTAGAESARPAETPDDAALGE
jgi:hypothetical protein